MYHAQTIEEAPETLHRAFLAIVVPMVAPAIHQIQTDQGQTTPAMDKEV